MNGYIDMHCDSLLAALYRKQDTICSMPGTMLDIERLKKSSAGAQFFAMFLDQKGERPVEETLERLYTVFKNTLEAEKDSLAFAGNYSDIIKNSEEGKISALLTIENGYPVLGKFENLKRFYDMGVRLITLTWNDPNCFGFNCSTDSEEMKRGLTDFGKEALGYMNELGIIIDVSHLSEGGFWDVAEISKKPFVASHSNCRDLCSHQRNLSDAQIKRLADCGGVSGINFEPSFLNKDLSDPHSRIERMCEHVEHFINLGGIECVGIGSDFDGIGGEHEIYDCTRVNLLFDALHSRGMSYDAIDKIRSGNVLRVIKDTL